MNIGRNWLGWLGISFGALALLIALSGWWFAPTFANSAANMPMPQYSQQGNRSQNSAQNGQFTPKADNRSGGGRQDAGMGRAKGQPTGGLFGVGRWFGFAFKLFEGLRNVALFVVLALLGVWLLRNRGVQRNGSTQAARGSAQEPRSPTGESYVDESGDAKE